MRETRICKHSPPFGWLTFKLHSPKSVLSSPVSSIKKNSSPPDHCIEIHSPCPETDLNNYKQKGNSNKFTPSKVSKLYTKTVGKSHFAMFCGSTDDTAYLITRDITLFNFILHVTIIEAEAILPVYKPVLETTNQGWWTFQNGKLLAY